MATVETGLRIAKLALFINALLAIGKIATGILGNSYVLIADGIESTADIFSSVVVWGGLRVSVLPADENHPFGHGKAEPVASIIVSMILLAAGLLIAVQSVHEILTPHHPPAWYTLPVLVVVVLVKETMFRAAFRAGRSLESTALKSDAWHHRSDALTSAAAFVGISIALMGGKGYESADDWAALLACGVITWNGLRLLRAALDELMDASVSPEVVAQVRELAAAVEGVAAIDKCRVRKAGLHLALDIHVVVDGDLTVRRGHEIAHRVKDRLLASQHRINDVTVHIEPTSG
ncbi:MAG TPA: cation diffusion facilitator family transporter [Verrucomicrobiae bacterium]|nr:cation diffusion facilitator family transporter [Verrucomicrobiae bacterium]